MTTAADADVIRRTAFLFVDETGRLPIPRDRFFAVGLLKAAEPAVVQRPMQALRDRLNFRVEIKWHEVRRNTLDIYKRCLDCFFQAPGAYFACFVADKTAHDPIKRFGDQWKAYEKLACQLVLGNILPYEYVTILADEYSTPASVTFEENLRTLVNDKIGRRAVVGVCRTRSTGVDLFQILDLLLGAVAYDYKAKAGLVDLSSTTPKAQLLAYIRSQFGLTTLAAPVRVAKLNIAEYGAAGIKTAQPARPFSTP